MGSGGEQSKSIILIETKVILKDAIAEDPEIDSEGACYVPVITGCDKTTVSVATGQNEYYPYYMSIGNVHNNVRRAHSNAIQVVAFLAIPKSEGLFSSALRPLTHPLAADKEHEKSDAYRMFRRQLLQSSISMILTPLKPGMEKPVINRFPDGHYRKTIYGLGPDICDYPEQVSHANVVSGWCTR